MAATGSAVGLGNIWKFPYVAGENGGGAFVLVYLGCVALIGLPVLMAEIMLGRRGGRSPVNSMARVAVESGRSERWFLLGLLGIITSFFLLSFYSVIAGWSAAYIFQTASGAFRDISALQIVELFDDFLASPWRLTFWHSVFMLITITVVSFGLHRGLERTIRVLVPGLFLILIILVLYSASTPGFMEGVRFLFKPDFSEFSGQAFLVALGHAFFTLSVATASMLIYGAYLQRSASIASTSVTIAFLDTLSAILAGLAIFPIVFTYALVPDVGPTLVFKSLPIAFGAMPGGSFFGSLFFLLLLFAALGSSISMVEPMVAWITERWKISRPKATWLTGGLIWLFGVGSLLSFNIWQEKRLLGWNYYEIVDALVSLLLLPLGALLLAVFAGWFMTRQASEDELAMPNKRLYQSWRFLVRYVAPLAVLVIVISLLR